MAHEHAEPGAVIDLNSFGESQSTAVVKEDRFEAIRIHLDPGRKIPAHKVDGPITVHCLSGKCVFYVEEQPRALEPGSWLYLEGGTVHSLEAEESCALLVTIIFV